MFDLHVHDQMRGRCPLGAARLTPRIFAAQRCLRGGRCDPNVGLFKRLSACIVEAGGTI